MIEIPIDNDVEVYHRYWVVFIDGLYIHSMTARLEFIREFDRKYHSGYRRVWNIAFDDEYEIKKALNFESYSDDFLPQIVMDGEQVQLVINDEDYFQQYFLKLPLSKGLQPLKTDWGDKYLNVETENLEDVLKKFNGCYLSKKVTFDNELLETRIKAYFDTDDYENNRKAVAFLSIFNYLWKQLDLTYNLN